MNEIFEKLDNIGAETEDALERFMDDEDMYLKYVREFPDEMSMKKLEKAIEDRDYLQAEKSVHALKGIVLNLGFITLADSTVDMLIELRKNNIEDALEAFEEVKEQYHLYSSVINEWKKEK